jgi:hypothetical protein
MTAKIEISEQEWRGTNNRNKKALLTSDEVRRA